MQHTELSYILVLFGFIALIGAFLKKKAVSWPQYIRVLGIVVVAIFASLLAINSSSALSATMGGLGTIGACIFGIQSVFHLKNTLSEQ